MRVAGFLVGRAIGQGAQARRFSHYAHAGASSGPEKAAESLSKFAAYGLLATQVAAWTLFLTETARLGAKVVASRTKSEDRLDPPGA